MNDLFVYLQNMTTEMIGYNIADIVRGSSINDSREIGFATVEKPTTPVWFIGTANFGMKYGFASNFSKVNENQIKKIMNQAKSSEFGGVDTAQGYGSAETIVGKYSSDLRPLLVTTKIDASIPGTKDALYNSILGSAKRLTRSPEIAYFHSLEHLLSVSPKELNKLCMRLKESGLETKIGVSVYRPEEVDRVLEHCSDIVYFQIPMNLMSEPNYVGSISNLVSLGIKFTFRSIFLQGILLTNPTDERLRQTLRRDEFDALIKLWAFVRDSRFSMLDLCLYHASTAVSASGVVVGVSSLKEFKEIDAAISNIRKGLVVDYPKMNGGFEKGFFDLRQDRFSR